SSGSSPGWVIFTADDTLKCMMVKITQPGEEPELAGDLIPGSRAFAPKRLEAALEPATFELATDADFQENSFLVKGYVGPRGLNANGVKVYADPRVVSGTSWITGADNKNHHVVGLVA